MSWRSSTVETLSRDCSRIARVTVAARGPACLAPIGKQLTPPSSCSWRGRPRGRAACTARRAGLLQPKG